MDPIAIPGDCARLLDQLVRLWQRNSSYLESPDIPSTLDMEITQILQELVNILALEPEYPASHSDHAESIKLTTRERDVLCWLAQGKTVSDIGILMQISKCTVRTYIQRSLKKLDVSNRTHAVSRALRFGLIDL